MKIVATNFHLPAGIAHTKPEIRVVSRKEIVLRGGDPESWGIISMRSVERWTGTA